MKTRRIVSSVKWFIILFAFTSLLIQPVDIFAGKLEPKIDLRDVKTDGEIGRRIDITINNNLLKIDADKDFLKPFQERKSSGGYIGLGKFIDSMVRMAAYSNDEKLLTLKNHVVSETIKTQEEDGYIGIMAPQHRMWKLWDIHEMNYVANGLITDYHFYQDEKSLNAAVKLIDYIIKNWTENPDGMKGTSITVFMAVTGLEETLLMMYDETGYQRYLDFCVDFRRLPQWDYPLDLGRWGKIGGHAYAYMHRCLAQLRLHQIEPDDALLSQTQKTISFLTQKDGLLINGVCSQHECWHDTQDGTEGLGETCATAYLIRVLDELIRMEQNSFYGDMMERSIYNGLFAAQSPDGRRLRYYVPFDGERVYFDGDTYCCPCNYRRIIAELPSMIYYRMDGGIAVNLYSPSSASIKLSNGNKVEISQETDYPNSGKVNISINPDKPASFPLRLRIPSWCNDAEVTVNNDMVNIQAASGEFLVLNRTWKNGDSVTLDLAMPLRLVKGRKAQAGRMAIMRGPQLFCVNPKVNQGLENVDLHQVLIDPDTLEGPFEDDTVRKNGLACTIKGWKSMGFTQGGNHNLDLRLTEFPDPDGTAAYFRVRQMGLVGVDDELLVKE